MKFPKLKKKVTSYLLSEEGKISKQSLMALGAFLGGAAISSVLLAEDSTAAHSSHSSQGHSNSLSLGYVESSGTATGTHSHHANHSSHSSHNSY